VRTSLEILVAAGLDVEHAPPHRAAALLFDSIILKGITFETSRDSYATKHCCCTCAACLSAATTALQARITTHEQLFPVTKETMLMSIAQELLLWPVNLFDSGDVRRSMPIQATESCTAGFESFDISQSTD
jgi:hypothetical protein